ncbi:MAG: FtsX-like permease family protein [Gemmatimonadaceae bacterium]|nr:FtsX-like permease family protein [Gemmatimonadaceae bacterium]
MVMHVRALPRKLLRDIVHLRGQFLAVGLVVASGIALFVALRSMNDFLRGSLADYYGEYRFADVFAPLKRAPRTLEPRLSSIPGVAVADTRLVFDVVLDVPGLAEPATGRLISIPEDAQPSLNALHLRAGRWIEPGARGEVLASDAFAQANALGVGDSVGAVLNGRWEWLHIVGIAMSPEYVYEIGGSGIMPDNRRFGVLWIGRRELSAVYDMESAFNDVSLSLLPGSSQPEVIAQVDRLLEPYGGLGAYGRDDQVSNRFVWSEIEETRVTSILIPSIFLGVTAFLVNLVMSRLVSTQRDQIGTLKAFGYSTREVVAHYFSLALVPVFAGSLVGIGVGLWLASQLALVYARFYRFPLAQFTPSWGVVALAVCIGGGAALAGAFSATRRAAKLPPAEAMRPEAPPRFRPGPLERMGLGTIASPAVRMILRGLERRPLKALIGITGIALAVAIVIASRYTFDAIDEIARVQFEEIERADVTVTYHAARSAAATRALTRLPGVLAAEPLRVVPVRLRHAQHERRTAILALAPTGELHRIVGASGDVQAPPDNGLVLTTQLADMLGARVGDIIEVHVLEGKRRVYEAPLSGTVDELVGTSAYMSAGGLDAMLGEGDAVTGAYLSVDPLGAATLYDRLKRLPAVSGVVVRKAAIESFDRTVAESFRIALVTVIVFATIIAFGVVYNGARTALSERGRELASLRVLGFTRGETAAMLLGEQAILTGLAMPLGMGIGYGLSAFMVVAYKSDLFRLPLVVSSASYLFSVFVIATAAAMSAGIVRRRIDHLDLVQVLKTRE